MKRIFYFNVTYGCNSNCIFCYSHNTRHGSITYNEINADIFFAYLYDNNLSSADRVIINGGEPLLHSEIDSILERLTKFGCEVLIYTNGRLLRKFDFSKLTEKYRFVVPIHGDEKIHDAITGVAGSYRETLAGMASVMSNSKCLVDIKIIINNYFFEKDVDEKKLLDSLTGIQFNNAVHITKMADTIISNKNNCGTVDNDDAAYYTRILFEYFMRANKVIKVFDTCVNKLNLEDYDSFTKYSEPIEVYFKDKNQFRKLDISKKCLECMNGCKTCDFCISAVDEYKVLEYNNGKIYESLE